MGLFFESPEEKKARQIKEFKKAEAKRSADLKREAKRLKSKKSGPWSPDRPTQGKLPDANARDLNAINGHKSWW
jgi:hypothetical protein